MDSFLFFRITNETMLAPVYAFPPPWKAEVESRTLTCYTIDVQFKDIVHTNALSVPIAYKDGSIDTESSPLDYYLLHILHRSIGCVCATHMLCFTYTGFSKILMIKTTIPCCCKMLLPVTKIYFFIFLAKRLCERRLTCTTQFSRLPWIVLPLCFF